MMVLFFGFWKNGYDGNQNRALYIHAMNGSLGARLVSKLFICKLMIFLNRTNGISGQSNGSSMC